ncbi:MAG: RsmE family RNA methyltransferase, partial [Acidimicrobiales bacterium]
LEADGPVVAEARPSPLVGVGFAPVKGERPEWVVQRLTEVGVDRILLLVAARSVVRWQADRVARHMERLRRVAREAAMQSRRLWLPEVLAPAPVGEVAAALAHPGGDAPGLDRPVVLVGPEGGWDEAELAGGRPLVGLGPTVLRAETAALAAGLALCGLRSGWVRAGGGRG